MPKYQEFDPTKDYEAEISQEDIQIDGDKKFIYLRGLEKLAKNRGVLSTSSNITPFTNGDGELIGASCTYTYVFADGGSFQGSADATKANLKGIVATFPVAVAESRAKARALRNAFFISTCSTEEKGAALEDFVSAAPTKIGAHQEMLIGHLKDKLGITDGDLVKNALGKESPIKNLSMEDGTALIVYLNKAIAAASKGKK